MHKENFPTFLFSAHINKHYKELMKGLPWLKLFLNSSILHCLEYQQITSAYACWFPFWYACFVLPRLYFICFSHWPYTNEKSTSFSLSYMAELGLPLVQHILKFKAKGSHIDIAQLFPQFSLALCIGKVRFVLHLLSTDTA